MNKIILFCGLALFLAFSAASDTQEESSLSAGSSPVRQAREAAPRRPRKKTKKGKSKAGRARGRKRAGKKGQRKMKKKSGRRNGQKKNRFQTRTTTKLLFDCEIDVHTACHPDNYPKHNDTILNTCVNLTETFEAEVGACMAKSVGKTSESDYSEACMCWEAESLANMSASVGDCKIQDTQKEITKQKAACTSAFAKCRKYEDEAISVLATCSQTKDKLATKAAALSSNNQTLNAAKEKMSSLAAGNSSRRVRQTATTCAEVIAKSSQVITIVSQSTSSSKISMIAIEISSVSSSVSCSTEEKTSLTTQISSVDSALDRIGEALTAVQEQLSTLTGSTADVAVTEPVSTSGPSARRQRLLKSLLSQ